MEEVRRPPICRVRQWPSAAVPSSSTHAPPVHATSACPPHVDFKRSTEREASRYKKGLDQDSPRDPDRTSYRLLFESQPYGKNQSIGVAGEMWLER
jgi:hypothetical protein